MSEDNQKHPHPESDSRLGSWAAGIAGWWRTARANPLFMVTLLGALIVTLIDQASKTWIVEVLHLPERRQVPVLPFFDLTMVRNYGASFGMLAGGLGSRILLSVLSLGISAFLVSWLATVKRPLIAIGLACILGGAIGNLIDRVLYGYVIDFLDFSDLYFPWVFNVADVSINIGVGFLILDFFVGEKQGQPPAQSLDT